MILKILLSLSPLNSTKVSKCLYSLHSATFQMLKQRSLTGVFWILLCIRRQGRGNTASIIVKESINIVKSIGSKSAKKTVKNRSKFHGKFAVFCYYLARNDKLGDRNKCQRSSGKRFMKIGYSEVPKPSYHPLLWPAE